MSSLDLLAQSAIVSVAIKRTLGRSKAASLGLWNCSAIFASLNHLKPIGI